MAEVSDFQEQVESQRAELEAELSDPGSVFLGYGCALRHQFFWFKRFFWFKSVFLISYSTTKSLTFSKGPL